jgi:hypothetical protein
MVLLTVTGLFYDPSQVLTQSADYSGRWRLNLEKSKLEHRPDGLTSSLFVIKQEGDKFSLTRYHIYGDKQKKKSFNMVADGRTKRIMLLFKSKLERNGNGLTASVWRKNFSNIVHYQFGSNENEFIADETFTSKHNNHHNVWVFDREVSE